MSFADGVPTINSHFLVCNFCRDRGTVLPGKHCRYHGEPPPCERCAQLDAAWEEAQTERVERVQLNYCKPHGHPSPCPRCVEDAEALRRVQEQTDREKAKREKKEREDREFAETKYRVQFRNPVVVEPKKSDVQEDIVYPVDPDSPEAYEFNRVKHYCQHKKPIFRFRAGEMNYCIPCLRAGGTPEADLNAQLRFVAIYAVCNTEGWRQKRNQKVFPYLDKLPGEDFVSDALVKVLMILDNNEKSGQPKKISLSYLRLVARNTLKNVVSGVMHRKEFSVDGQIVMDEDGKEMTALEKLDSSAYAVSGLGKDVAGIARERGWNEYINRQIPGGESALGHPNAYTKTRQYLIEAMELLPKFQIRTPLPFPAALLPEGGTGGEGKYPPMDVALMIRLNCGALEFDDENGDEWTDESKVRTTGISCEAIAAQCSSPVSGRTVQRWIDRGLQQMKNYMLEKFGGKSVRTWLTGKDLLDV